MCRIFSKACEISDVRGSAARQVLRRMGGIQGNFARSAEIQRRIHLLGKTDRNCAPHYSSVDCVEICPWRPWGNSDVRGSAIRPVLWRRGEILRYAARPAEIQRHRHLLGMKGRGFAHRDSSADCVAISSGNREKSRMCAGPPPGRVCGEGARFR